MSHNRLTNHGLIGVFILGIGSGFILALPWFANQQGLAAHPDTLAAETCYATYNNGATTYMGSNASALQGAVDAAPPDGTVKIAGTCKGVSRRAGTDQTVYIEKNLTLQGGHTYTDWSKPPDPDTYPTTLDADEKGRVAVIKGNLKVTLKALQFTNGRANDGTLSNHGAGIWTDCSLTLEDSNVFGNIADHNGGGFYCDGFGSGNTCSPILKKVTFSGNSADSGGAMYNYSWSGESSPTLTDVTFSGNSSELYGGAIFNDSYQGESSPNLTKVTFSENSAGDCGGAMYNYGKDGKSNPSLINVIFSGNSAANNGGAIFNNGYDGKSSPSLANVTFSGNFAGREGGAMFNYGGSSGTSNPSLTNVTFSGNVAADYGGAMYNSGQNGTSNPKVYNSILWNNKDSSGTGTIEASIRNYDATTTLSHSLIQGSGGSNDWKLNANFVDGGSNIDTNPVFVTPVNPSNAPTTAGNLRLKSGSPAIDAGRNTFIAGIGTDLDDLPRFIDGDADSVKTVDLGAYEFPAYEYLEFYVPLAFR